MMKCQQTRKILDQVGAWFEPKAWGWKWPDDCDQSEEQSMKLGKHTCISTVRDIYSERLVRLWTLLSPRCSLPLTLSHSSSANRGKDMLVILTAPSVGEKTEPSLYLSSFALLDVIWVLWTAKSGCCTGRILSAVSLSTYQCWLIRQCWPNYQPQW